MPRPSKAVATDNQLRDHRHSLAKTSMKLDANAVPQGGVVWVFALRRHA